MCELNPASATKFLLLDQHLTVNCSFLRIVQLISHHTLSAVRGISEVNMASIRKLKFGNYQVQIRLLGLRPIVRSFRTKKESQEFAHLEPRIYAFIGIQAA